MPARSSGIIKDVKQLYKVDALGSSLANVRIGSDGSKFLPNVNSSFEFESGSEKYWMNFNKKDVSITDEKETFDETKISLAAGNYEQIWSLKSDDTLKWDLVLSNGLESVFTWEVKVSPGVMFYYQPHYPTDHPKYYLERETTGVAGSYAVYCDRAGHYRKRDGQTVVNYKTGKLCHIYRPKAIDANSKAVWCDLLIEPVDPKDLTVWRMVVTIPQTFLDAAVYPVILDPDFGYKTVGGSAYASYNFCGANFEAPADGNITSMSVYLYSSGSGTIYLGYWTASSLDDSTPETHIAHSSSGSPSGTEGWKELDVSGSITDGNIYALIVQQTTQVYYEYEDAAAGTHQHYTGLDSPPTWDNNPSIGDGYADIKTSIYATYTEIKTLTVSGVLSSGSALALPQLLRDRKLDLLGVASAGSVVDSLTINRLRILALTDLLSGSDVDITAIVRRFTLLFGNISAGSSLLCSDLKELITGGQDMADANWVGFWAPTVNEQADHDGQNDCRHVTGNGPSGIVYSPGYTTEVDAIYHVQFRLKVISGSVSIIGITGAGDPAHAIYVSMEPASWTSYSATYTETTGGPSATLIFYAAENSTEFYLDEVSVQKLEDVRILRDRSLGFTDVAAASQVDDALVDIVLRMLRLINVACSSATGPVSMNRMRRLVFQALQAAFSVDSVTILPIHLYFLTLASVVSGTEVDAVTLSRIRALAVAAVESMTAVDDIQTKRLLHLLVSDIKAATSISTIVKRVVAGILIITANAKSFSILSDPKDFSIVADAILHSIEANEKDFSITAN